MPEPTEPAPSFEAGLEELDQIVKQMEAGEMPLEQALALFERGMQISAACRKRLDEAETRVEMLVRRGEKIAPEPFEPER